MTTTQAPLGSGFGAHTTAREVLAGQDLSGRIAIVTGGYSGIGTETTRALSEAGATVIVPARNPEKARAAVEGLARVELETLDLDDPASIDAFTARFVASQRPLHMLVNSAGIMAVPLEHDARGYERHFATNHLGHFQLTARLWPALRRAGGARVVSVSSRGHRRAGIDFEDPFYERRPYEKLDAYGQSKTANVLFAVALDARGQSHGVRAFSLHPGAIMTDLARHMSKEDLRGLGALDANGDIPETPPAGFKNTEQGAATQVWCATSPRLEGHGGVYCQDADIAKAVAADDQGSSGVWPWAIDPALAERLWTASERWTVPFTI